MHYELIVIGSGPAGEKAATTAAALGRKVALVEKDPFVGGASTNTGTLPSKTFRETSLALSGIRTRGLYGSGLDLSLKRKATVEEFMYHEDHVKSQERARVLSVLGHWNVDFYLGTASFTDPHTITVANDGQQQSLTGDFFMLATGSSPVRPAAFPFEHPCVHDSDEILTIEKLPDSMAVVGAGVIGTEYACTFAALGVQVILIDGRETLLSFLDHEVSAELTASLTRLNIQFLRPMKVTSCDVPDCGQIKLTCDRGEQISVDQVLVAAGRCSNVGQLNLAAVGITPGPRGLISVDEKYCTSVPHILAAGDIIGFPALAATSAEQGRIAVCHAFNSSHLLKMNSILPTGIYTIPEVSMIGETEQSLNEKKIPFVIGRASYAATVRGQIIGDRHGFLKLLFSDDGEMKLLGAHCIGEIASEVIHIGLMAMVTGQGRDLFEAACFNYPTLGELYKTATYDATAKRFR